MGIIKAIGSAVSGGLADQWLEVFEADDMGEQTVFTSGVLIRRGQNTKGTNNTVSNGSVIHVYDNQFMMLVDGGKVVDYTAEPGYYSVTFDNGIKTELTGRICKRDVQPYQVRWTDADGTESIFPESAGDQRDQVWNEKPDQLL